MEKKLFEGTGKPILDLTDRFVTGYPNIEGAQYTTKEELFEQIRIEQGTRLTPIEVTSVAPLFTGAATLDSLQTIRVEDSTKSWGSNSLTGKAVTVTRTNGSKEVRIISLNGTTYFIIETSFPFTSQIQTGETYEIIEPTVLTDNFRNQIVRVNLSSGFNHVVQHPFVDIDRNRNVITTYIEGHSGNAVCYGITTPPESGSSLDRQTFNGTGNVFELVANRELVSHAAHATGSYHYDLLYSSGLQAFGQATWAAQVITANQTTFTPVNSNLTIKKLLRFTSTTISGELWGVYTSQIKRNFRFNVICDGVLNGPNASIIEVGIRHYSAETGITTDYTGVGGNVTVSGTNTAFRFTLIENIELSFGDRFQIVHKNNNATDYTITPKLVVG